MAKKPGRKISVLSARAKMVLVKVNDDVRRGTSFTEYLDFAAFVAGMRFAANVSRVDVDETSPQSWVSYKNGHDALKRDIRNAIKTLKDEEDLMSEYCSWGRK